MTIFPSLVAKDGHVQRYSSSAVFTTLPNGEKRWVSDGYEASDRVEIIKLAVMNMAIRQQVWGLARSKAA